MAFDSRNGSDRTLSQLIAEAMQDVTTIIRKEIQLAKAEITGSLAFAKKGLPLLVVGKTWCRYRKEELRPSKMCTGCRSITIPIKMC